MVKVECTDSGDSSDVEILGQTVPLVGSSGSKPCSGLNLVKEETLPSSSSGHLKSYFIGMGFSPTLVDKVIEENGEDHTDLLLEALLKHSALQKSSPDASNSLDGFSSFDDEEDSPLEFTTDDSKENQELNVPSNVDLDKKSYLLTMDFSEEEVDLAISQLGENAPLTELVDFIVTAQSEGFPGQKDMNATCSSDVGKNEENTTEALFGMMDKTLYLLQMGFTEDEISSAIDNFDVMDCGSKKWAEEIAGCSQDIKWQLGFKTSGVSWFLTKESALLSSKKESSLFVLELISMVN